METSSSIWEIIEENKVLEPMTLKHSYHIKNAIVFNVLALRSLNREDILFVLLFNFLYGPI